MYDKPSQAFAAARISGETYQDDFAVIERNGLRIEGVSGRPLIKQSATAIFNARGQIEGEAITPSHPQI